MNPAEAAASLLDLPIDDVLILQSAHTTLLVAAARGEIDLNELARATLADRGLDKSGRWVGFAEAQRQANATA